MLIGIVKEETHNESYYINLDRKNNKNELSIIHASDDRVESLSKEKAIELLKTLLSSKLTYKEKEEDYDIYLDEANNKRYFKNGKENYFKTIEKNGTDAIMYLNKLDKNQKTTTKKIKLVCGALAFVITISPLGLLKLAHDTTYTTTHDYALISIEKITAKEVVQEIKKSPSLTEEEKELLANETYFEFVLRNTTTTNRNYQLRKSFKDITIKSFMQEELEGANGFHNHLEPNAIYILEGVEKNKSKYHDVLVHEFIHLTQDYNDYRFIREACAELLEHEFFNLPCDSYPDAITRVRVLMEIIGPQPIIDCNFKGDTKSFEDSIKKYLNEEDANKLLELFTLPVLQQENNKEETTLKNKQIDELLSKMYKNKTGKDIESDETINEVKKLFTDRIYFNPNHENYNKDFGIYKGQKEIGTLTLEETLKYDEIDDFVYRINKSPSKKIKIYTTESTKDFNSIPLKNLKDVTIKYKNGNYSYIKYDSETKEWSKAKIYSKEEIREYVPSIAKKFPDQAQQKIEIYRSNTYDIKPEKSM